MQFAVANELFAQFPRACFGVVVAHAIPVMEHARISDMLQQAAGNIGSTFPTGVRSHSHIAVWRDAFTALGYNPNKFLSSVEALASRVYKSGQMPSINAIVDLVNSFSLRYVLPMGAHDLKSLQGSVEIRLSRVGDSFTPFGTEDAEDVPPGEVVYASGATVRTRRWVWRQSEHGKITAATQDVFFPIDGFAGVTDQAVLAARDELASFLRRQGARVQTGWVDASRPVYAWDDAGPTS